MSNTPQPEKRKKLISIVVPVYNEEANLQHFTMAVDRVCSGASSSGIFLDCTAIRC